MDDKFNVTRDVGVAVNAESGATVHVHIQQPPQQPGRKDVAMLLNTCNTAGCKLQITRISYAFFGDKFFKNLSPEQVKQLQIIADEFLTITPSKIGIVARISALFIKKA